MPEPITTISLGLASAYLTKDGLNKLLGPTADYLGQELKEFTKKRAENIGHIFKNAEHKLGSRINAKGQVPPKVLKEIMDGGSFCNEPLSIEYLGGILASSRTEKGRDDRGARMAKIVDSLSSYQLRAHYLIYATVRQVFLNKKVSFNLEQDRVRMQIYIPFSSFFAAMDFDDAEQAQIRQILDHLFFGLSSEGLTEGHWKYGPREHIVEHFKNCPEEGGIICSPSGLGVELFLWAFGHANKHNNFIFDASFLPLVDGIDAPIKNACATD